MLLIIEALLVISAALGQDHRNAAAGQIFPLDMAPNSVDDNYDSCTKEMANLVKTKYLEKEMSDLPEFKKSWQEAALGQDHRAVIEGMIYPLDMALDSVDDQYMGCAEKMLRLVQTVHLRKELSNPQSTFAIAWKDAVQYAKQPEDNLTKNQSIAIYVYTDNRIYNNFNKDVSAGKRTYKDSTFKWYSLHFLLTEAIQTLKKTQKECKPTYRGANVEFDKNVKGKNIRFGSFASSSLDRNTAQGFGSKSCFEIYTCKGVDLAKYSKYPNEREVLIPPYETFKVTDVKTKGQEAALGQDHRVAVAEEYPLDMALNSVDDQYNGCRENMANHVETKYLEKEINNSPDFKIAWKNGKDFVKTPHDKDLTKNHLIAIYVYSASNVYEQFNHDTRDGKRLYKQMRYKWYSLYFLLTDAIQILNKTQNKCYSTFRGTKAEFDKHVLNKEIRFGQFASSSLDRKKTKRFGTKSCFEIHTCEGADVSKYSKLPREKEVLIPPYEKFKVTAVKTRKDQKDPWCDTVYVLKSSGKKSDLNCALFKKPTKTIMK
ncbi:NAD(P)(+)--arginine ADP-ribosyltransferase 2-like protein [Labeo rohita]|uniref:NAD(P)(+)--arginine ADP-ribosyltransferase n=1 Tax=Labeo rohita TaxID=84645 RepID=A0A498NQN7_LABRO|nr:NAD(P)(+)--arginine ADP-ribosyltransferase 2-like protein [Labeo rohita]